MQKAQITIQDLINRNNEYKAKAWFSKDNFFQNFWSKLTSAYSNLNHVMASEIVEAIKNVPDSLKFDGYDQDYATNFAQLLVDKRVSISALVGVMREGKLSFSGQHFYKFLDTLHKGYVGQPGLFTEEVMARMEAIKALPYDGAELTQDEKNYIQDAKTPLELVDMLIQKSDSKSFGGYPNFVQDAVQNCKKDRKTEVILLGLKNLMNYENLYTDKVVVEQGGLQNVYNPANAPDDKIDAKTQNDCVNTIKTWIENGTDEEKTALATKIFNSLNGSNLIGTGYEKSVVDYVAKNRDNQDKAIAYSIYKAREAVKGKIQTSAESLRQSLRGVDQINLIKTDEVIFQKDAKDIPIKIFLEKAANSVRLQRAAKRYVMKQLNGAKLKDAAAVVSGQGNLQAMAAMLGSMDQETFTLIGKIMGSTMAEIGSEHNFNPKFWAGTMSRGWNKVTSYPADAFFAVIDFFAIVFAYIGEYVTRGAFWAYEGVRDLVGKPVAEKRQNQDIFKQADVEAAMAELVKSLQGVNTDQVKSTDKDQLRDAIITFFKDDSNSDNLKGKLDAVHDSIGEGNLKTAIDKIKDQDLTQHKKALQAILDMPEMKQSASNVLPSWARSAKALSVLKLTKSI